MKFVLIAALLVLTVCLVSVRDLDSKTNWLVHGFMIRLLILACITTDYICTMEFEKKNFEGLLQVYRRQFFSRLSVAV